MDFDYFANYKYVIIFICPIGNGDWSSEGQSQLKEVVRTKKGLIIAKEKN